MKKAVTCTAGGASSGKRAIGSVGIAIAPARMISSEQTVERTGRLMKTSANMAYEAFCSGAPGAPAGGPPAITGAPSRIFWMPPVMSCSPGVSPASTT